MKLALPQEMKKWEKEVFSKYDVPSILFMEQAGRSLFSFIQDKIKVPKDKKIAIVSGSGNNGGDGVVCARYLKEAGYNVTLFALFESLPKTEDALINFRFYKESGGEVFYVNKDNLNKFREILRESGLIVDAILGIGIEREVTGFYKDVIQSINNTLIPVLSADGPSGINLSNGKILGTAIKATYTVTFALPKVGLYIYPGRYFAGSVTLESAGFPLCDVKEFDTHDILIDKDMVLSIFPSRAPWGHKGTFGKVLTIAGSRGFTGASYLTSLSVLKSGGGLSYLVIPESLDDQIKSLTPEVITYPVPEKDGHIAYTAYEYIMEKVKDVDAVAIGPGLGTSEGVKRLVAEIVQSIDKPFVLDADGLNVLSGTPEILHNVKVPFVITPHPGELGRIIGKSAKEVDEDRINIARDFSKEYKNLILVLKGATTIVASNGMLYYNITGNSGMATGGSGDVLTGIIAFLLGIGIKPLNSAIIGTYIHGLAGDMASSYKGEFGMTATDLIAYLPYVIKTIEEELK